VNEEIEAAGLLSSFYKSTMDRSEFQKVIETAAAERDCRVVGVGFNDDDNVFEVTLAKTAEGESVDLQDCEFVHRAVLAAFDRDVEDYALTVSSQGMSAEEADEMLKTVKE